MIKKIQKFLQQNQIDFLLLPNSDEFFSEYVPDSEKRIEFISGFNGSNATIIFSQQKCYFFTDGRYILQAQQQLDSQEFVILNTAQNSVLSWLSVNADVGQRIALDARLTAVSFVNSCRNLSLDLLLLPKNPIDEFWVNRPSPKNSKIYSVPLLACGQDSLAKRRQIVAELLDDEILLISKPENLCWLLNIRASDIDFTPLMLAYGLLLKSGEVVLFVDQERVAGLDLPQVTAIANSQIEQFLINQRLKSSLVRLDENTTNCWFYEVLQQQKFTIRNKICPIEIAKAVKNSVEISGARVSHELDAVAIIKFLLWFKNSVSQGVKMSEISLAKKLLEFRQESQFFAFPSFETIAGFAENGAIIHYKATKETNKELSGDSLFLLDSGGQYLGEDFYGTTDITRTIYFGKPSGEMIQNYSLVLKGHLALARVKFPKKTTGAQLDSLARFYLWQFGKDYDHGTGHGVGAFMSVHEGPCGISKRANQELLPGMILSNEPGVYLPGNYGVRLENLQLVCEFDEKFLCFETLTLVPFVPELIDFSMLTYPEKKWLANYHLQILSRLRSRLNQQQIDFLAVIVAKFDAML